MVGRAESNSRIRPGLVVAIASLIVAASCSSADTSEASTTTDRLQTSAPASAVTTTSSSPSPGTTHETQTSTTSSVASSTTTTLPGDRYEGPGPQQGDLVGVVGVSHNDVLNVRQGPGVAYAVVGTLEPEAAGIPITGAARLLVQSIWYEVEYDLGIGWVASSFIGLVGMTDDATALVAQELGSPLADDDIESLGATIAFMFLGEEGGGWIALVAPDRGGSVEDIHSVTYDIIGLDDDAVKGYRLVVHATRASAEGPFVMHSVERTHMCWRGIDANDSCV